MVTGKALNVAMLAGRVLYCVRLLTVRFPLKLRLK